MTVVNFMVTGPFALASSFSMTGPRRRSRGGTRPPRPSVRGKGGKVVLVPLPPTVARALDRAVNDRDGGPVLRNTLRHAASRRLKHQAAAAGSRVRAHDARRPALVLERHYG